jgi:hypothetical protein
MRPKEMSAMMRDIEFASRGITCRAWLGPPESEVLRNGRGYPALVMAHGTSGVRQQLKQYVPRRGWGRVGQNVPEEIDIRIHAKGEER